jgi:FtsH-binding integral membrane protein
MSYDQSKPQSVAAGVVIDAGLQSYMRGVFNTMSVGLGITGVTAYAIASIPPLAQIFLHSPLSLVVAFAPLVFLWMGFSTKSFMNNDAGALRTRFFIFSAVMGASFAAIFAIFTGAAIARAFFITAGIFAATSIWGYSTRRDLTGMASFLFMGLVGIVLASLVNLLLGSTAVQLAISFISVFVFTGMTAFYVQRLKEIYRTGGGEANDKAAIMGALSLYMNFINLFQVFLQITSGMDRRN